MKKTQNKKTHRKKSQQKSPASTLSRMAVGAVMGVVLFLFIALLVNAMPEGLQGERKISYSLQIIFFELPTLPFRKIAEIGGYSLSGNILFFCSTLFYALAGALANFFWTAIRK